MCKFRAAPSSAWVGAVKPDFHCPTDRKSLVTYPENLDLTVVTKNTLSNSCNRARTKDNFVSLSISNSLFYIYTLATGVKEDYLLSESNNFSLFSDC